MKWQVKYMVDPGDGIVSTAEIEVDDPSYIDDITTALKKALDQFPTYWVFAIEALPPDEEL